MSIQKVVSLLNMVTTKSGKKKKTKVRKRQEIRYKHPLSK